VTVRASFEIRAWRFTRDGPSARRERAARLAHAWPEAREIEALAEGLSVARRLRLGEEEARAGR
jgi:hypothetical protein